jgi:hypothetical protein
MGQKKSNSAHVLWHDMMPESDKENLNVGAYVNYNTIEKINPDVAKTLCARDYKGFGTGWDTMNGVIECKK